MFRRSAALRLKVGELSGARRARKDLLPTRAKVPLFRALWSLIDGIWGLSKGTWGVLAKTSVLLQESLLKLQAGLRTQAVHLRRRG